ncbi:hypothetical protein [Cyclobacterium roseum]|nr:hypothetical protein [Cyclobacterium roseum]
MKIADKLWLVTGGGNGIMDYMYRVNPDWAMRVMARKMKGHLSKNH